VGLVGGLRKRYFIGNNSKLQKLPENAHAAKLQSHHDSPGAFPGVGPRGRVHLVMMPDDHFPRKNAWLSGQRKAEKCESTEKKTHFGSFLGDVLRTLCWAALVSRNEC
jgi:hypothetical protein